MGHFNSEFIKFPSRKICIARSACVTYREGIQTTAWTTTPGHPLEALVRAILSTLSLHQEALKDGGVVLMLLAGTWAAWLLF